MVRSLHAVTACLLAGGLLAACADSKSGPPTSPSPPPATPFATTFSVYPVGGTRAVPGTSLTVTLERVVEDKRCPVIGPCPQPGRAIVELTVRDGGVPVRERFTMAAVDDFGGRWHDETEVAGYKFSLTTITPVPRNQPPDPSSPIYSANFHITR